MSLSKPLFVEERFQRPIPVVVGHGEAGAAAMERVDEFVATLDDDFVCIYGGGLLPLMCSVTVARPGARPRGAAPRGRTSRGRS